MKKISGKGRRLLRKIYTGLGLTSVALVFQACYGTPQSNGYDVLIRGTVKSSGADQSPVPGIKVSTEESLNDYELTDTDGKFQFYVPTEDSYLIKFEDIDGPENGEYSPQTLPVSLNEAKNGIDIRLDAK